MAVSIVLWALSSVPLDGESKFTEVEVDKSLFAGVTHWLSPAFEPLGFGTWQATSALVTGFVAKEVVVSTLSQVYATEEIAEGEDDVSPGFFEDLGSLLTSFASATWDTIKAIPLIVGIDLSGREEEPQPSALMTAIQADFEKASGGHGALAGLSFMVFVLIYTPCMVAVAAEKQELGTRWMWTSVIGQLILAWIMAFIVFQGGILLGLG